MWGSGGLGTRLGKWKLWFLSLTFFDPFAHFFFAHLVQFLGDHLKLREFYERFGRQ